MGLHGLYGAAVLHAFQNRKPFKGLFLTRINGGDQCNAGQVNQLFERLNENLAEFRAKWAAMSGDALIDSSREITAIKDAHYYLTESHGFEPEEADYLLLFQNPLQVVTDKWLERTEDLVISASH